MIPSGSGRARLLTNPDFRLGRARLPASPDFPSGRATVSPSRGLPEKSGLARTLALPQNKPVRREGDHIGRRKPASGVRITLGEPTIVFVTVNSEKRVRWIAQPAVQELLVQAWREAEAWLVGYYILMPDHIHFFCAPRDLDIPLDRWVSYWKRLFTLKAKNLDWQWQSHKWDTRLRRSENYQEKWLYIRENPMRKGSSRRQRIGPIKAC